MGHHDKKSKMELHDTLINAKGIINSKILNRKFKNRNPIVANYKSRA